MNLPLNPMLISTFGGHIPFYHGSFRTGIKHLPETRRSDAFMRRSRKLHQRIAEDCPGVVIEQSRFTMTGSGGLLDQDEFRLTKLGGKQPPVTLTFDGPAGFIARWKVYRAAKKLSY